jgi:hypothetical protein
MFVMCYPAYGPPQTFCSCGHYIEMHVRKPGTTAAVCVECMAVELQRLDQRLIEQGANVQRVTLVELSDEEQEALELLALRRLLEKAHRDEDGR